MENRLIVTLNIEELKLLIGDCLKDAHAILKEDVKEEDALLKRTEVAKIFGVSLVTLNQWRKEGIIKRHKIKSRVFFKKSEVMDALNTLPQMFKLK
jgi:hypothetical protein